MLKASNRTASSTQTRADAGDAPAESAHVDQRTLGKSLRDTCPRESHADWKPPSDRPDPMKLLEHSNKRRMVELIPIRFGRMVRTPFTFYRGAALNMAVDLAVTPTTGLRVQACSIFASCAT